MGGAASSSDVHRVHLYSRAGLGVLHAWARSRQTTWAVSARCILLSTPRSGTATTRSCTALQQEAALQHEVALQPTHFSPDFHHGGAGPMAAATGPGASGTGRPSSSSGRAPNPKPWALSSESPLACRSESGRIPSSPSSLHPQLGLLGTPCTPGTPGSESDSESRSPPARDPGPAVQP
jgi:hypothetical protein